VAESKLRSSISILLQLIGQAVIYASALRQIMARKWVSEPAQETSPLLAVDDSLHVISHTENAGGSAVDGTASVLHRNEGEIVFKLQTF
jgi:hypothetical protein